MPPTQQFWNVLLTPLAPIHIGSGRDYEDTDYLLHEEHLYAFDLARLAQATPPWLAQLGREALGTGAHRSPTEIRKAVRSKLAENQPELLRISHRSIPVAAAFAEIYRGATQPNALPNEFNRLQVARTIFTSSDERPYIPGSSFKGALRTAVLDALRARHAGGPGPRDAAAAERQLLGGGVFKTEADPFSTIAISDLMPNEAAATEVLLALNRRRHPTDDQAAGKGIPQYLECVPAFSAVFAGQVAFHLGRRAKVNWPDGFPGDAPALARACTAFFRPQFDAEVRTFAKELDGDWLKNVKAIFEEVEQSLITGAAFLLRLGHHSGAEALTLNEWRTIKIIGAKGRPARFAKEPTTSWLAAESGRGPLRPFGWALAQLAAPGAAPPAMEALARARTAATRDRNAAPPAGPSARSAPAAAAPASRRPAPASPAAPALSGKAAELRDKVKATRPRDIPGAIDGWYQNWLKLSAPADRDVFREAIIERLREWRGNDQKTFAKHATAKPWLAEWVAGAGEPKP